MNNLGFLIPIAAIIIGPVTWAFTTWVRARHGYPLDSHKRNGGSVMPINRQTELLSAEMTG